MALHQDTVDKVLEHLMTRGQRVEGGVELYEAMACVNRELTASDITCPADPNGNATFNGCSEEQIRFAQCD
ncbi:MAG: hypothetical protein ABIQ16_00595 [Polyangiaceae bacterium]